MNALTAMPTLSTRLSPRQNHLLAALPSADYERLVPCMQLVPLPLGCAIYEAGDKQRYVYFPVTGIVSKFWNMEDGFSAEVAVVGNEGVVGVPVVMGGGSLPSRAVVQRAGYAQRLKASALEAEFARGGALQHLLLRYVQALMTQMSQTVVCNRYHVLEQQLCRLLLLCLDRSFSNELTMTHASIAHMLGVRREGVTGAAAKLHAAGLIDYRRGHITVLDRPKLEARVCECYTAVKREYDRLADVTAISARQRSAGFSPIAAPIGPSIPPLRIATAAAA
jgi:CRP-like cAMP-binding protein